MALMEDDSNQCSDIEDEGYFSIMHVEEGKDAKTLKHKLSPKDTPKRIKELYRNSKEGKTEHKDECYRVAQTGGKFGKCVIINVENRTGSREDKDNLEDLFKKLNFDVSPHSLEKNEMAEVSQKLEEACDTMANPDIVGEALAKAREVYVDLKMKAEELKKKSGGKKNDQKTAMDIIRDHIRKSEGVEKEEYQAYNMFVLIIMAHGSNGYVDVPKYGCIKLADIYRELAHDKFKAFDGKPKWIIVQACSGDSVVEVTDCTDNQETPQQNTMEDSSSDSENISVLLDADVAVLTEHTRIAYRIKQHKTTRDDLCVWLASFPDNPAVRNAMNGSWFVRAILDVLYKHSHHMHLRELFQRVQDKVRYYGIFRYIVKTAKIKVGILKKEEGGYIGGQYPIEMCTFPRGKKVYLFPGLSTESQAGQSREIIAVMPEGESKQD